jgi:hypothetical protein
MYDLKLLNYSRKTGEIPEDTGTGNDFVNRIPIAQGTKSKNP